MSGMYRFALEILGFKPEKKEDIQAKVEAMWDAFDTWVDHQEGEARLSSEGTDTLAGVSDVEFAGQLAVAIWKANGAFCKVTVSSTFLDDIPTDTYELAEEEYRDFVAKEQARTTSTEDGI